MAHSTAQAAVWAIRLSVAGAKRLGARSVLRHACRLCPTELQKNNGIIGLGPDPPDDTIPEGYDGGIEIRRDWDEEFEPWTPAERTELADEMIRRWTAFK